MIGFENARLECWSQERILRRDGTGSQLSSGYRERHRMVDITPDGIDQSIDLQGGPCPVLIGELDGSATHAGQRTQVLDRGYALTIPLPATSAVATARGSIMRRKRAGLRRCRCIVKSATTRTTRSPAGRSFRDSCGLTSKCQRCTSPNDVRRLPGDLYGKSRNGVHRVAATTTHRPHGEHA